MAWFAELAGKAENLLNNIDEQTGVALRNHTNIKSKKRDISLNFDKSWIQNKRPVARSPIRTPLESSPRSSPNRKFSQPHQAQSHLKERENIVQNQVKQKSPVKKNNAQNSPSISPRISKNEMKAGEWGVEHYGLRKRSNFLFLVLAI